MATAWHSASNSTHLLIELLAYIDAELLLNLIGRYFILIRDERVKFDSVFIVHLDTVRVFELQPCRDITHSHKARHNLLGHYVFDVSAIDLDTLTEDILMCLRGAHIGLHTTCH